MTVVPVTTADLDAAEVSWFAALCSDDYAYLGVPNGQAPLKLGALFRHRAGGGAAGGSATSCARLLPGGQDTLSFVARLRADQPTRSISSPPCAAARCSRSC